jgi:hypothetical protein
LRGEKDTILIFGGPSELEVELFDLNSRQIVRTREDLEDLLQTLRSAARVLSDSYMRSYLLLGE